MLEDYTPQTNPSLHDILTMNLVRDLFRYNRHMVEGTIVSEVDRVNSKAISTVAVLDSSLGTILLVLMSFDFFGKMHSNFIAALEMCQRDLEATKEIFDQFSLRRNETDYLKIPGETLVKIQRDIMSIGNRLTQLTNQARYHKEQEDKRAGAAGRPVKPTFPPLRMIKEGAMPPGWESRKRWWWPF